MNYGRNPNRPEISVGDLVTYRTVGSGRIKGKIIALDAPGHYMLHGHREHVTIRVTERNNPYYHAGQTIHASPLWLNKRTRRVTLTE